MKRRRPTEALAVSLRTTPRASVYFEASVPHKLERTREPSNHALARGDPST